MSTVRIIRIHEQYDGDGNGDDPESYILEYTIPDYSGTFRTEPIPAEEYDEETAKERVRAEVPNFGATTDVNIEIVEGEDPEQGFMSRRRTLAYSSVLFAGLGGTLATIGGYIHPFSDGTQSPDPVPRNSTGTPTATPEPTETPTPQVADDEGFVPDTETDRTPTPQSNTATQTPQPSATDIPSGSVLFDFTDDAMGWSFGKRVDERSSAGEGQWAEKYDGSLRLHVDGAPSAIQTWRGFDSLAEGQEITVEYGPERFAYAEAGIHLRLVTSDGNRIGLDSDNDMEGGGREQDGTLTGTVPRDLADADIEIHLVIWPGETTVWIQSVSVAESE